MPLFILEPAAPGLMFEFPGVPLMEVPAAVPVPGDAPPVGAPAAPDDPERVPPPAPTTLPPAPPTAAVLMLHTAVNPATMIDKIIVFFIFRFQHQRCQRVRSALNAWTHF